MAHIMWQVDYHMAHSIKRYLFLPEYSNN